MNTKNKKNTLHSVYKYISMEDYHLKSLLNDELFIGTSERFNDPLDVQPYINLSVREKYAESLLQNAKRNGEDVSEDYHNFKVNPVYRREFTSQASTDYIRHLKKIYLVASFTSDPTSNIMWGHYGCCYEGAVIEYSRKDIRQFASDYTVNFYGNKLPKDILDLMSRSIVLEDVEYREFKADISSLMHRVIDYVSRSKEKGQGYMDLMREVKLDDNEFLEQMKMMYFYKDERWQYEKEVRLVFQNHEYDKDGIPDLNGKTFFKIKPISIRIGYRMNDDKKISILKYCHKNNIDVLFSFPSYNLLEYKAHDIALKRKDIPDFISHYESLKW